MSAQVLIIDDEPDILKLLDMSISRMGHHCDTAIDVKSALALLKQKQYSLCLTDKNLPDGDGFEIIEFCQANLPDLPVAMITAYGNLDTAIDAMKLGAFDFLPKPVSFDSLKKLINAAIKQSEDQPSAKSTDFDMVGNSEAMLTLKSQVSKVAKNQAPVYIQGESGSGKELVARLIHNQSSRNEGPFIAVNCGAIPSELMESEFFGHKKGSFTGASSDKQGLFSAAEGGTLFLDEVADLPLNMQVKLLRTLQEKMIRPIGATKEEAIDVRILSASHKNLNNEVQEKRFREDLYYRVNVIELNVPSLKDRASDISLLSEHLLEKISKKYESPLTKLSKQAENTLLAYDFPGNVRELENILERAYTLCENNIIQADDIVLPAAQLKTTNNLIPSTTHSSSHSPSPSIANTNENLIDINDALGNYDEFIANIERQVIEMALEKTRWNKTQAADLLGLSFRTLRYKITKLDIN